MALFVFLTRGVQSREVEGDISLVVCQTPKYTMKCWALKLNNIIDDWCTELSAEVNLHVADKFNLIQM